jgi:hypothetical protein
MMIAAIYISTHLHFLLSSVFRLKPDVYFYLLPICKIQKLLIF